MSKAAANRVSEFVKAYKRDRGGATIMGILSDKDYRLTVRDLESILAALKRGGK